MIVKVGVYLKADDKIFVCKFSKNVKSKQPYIILRIMGIHK